MVASRILAHRGVLAEDGRVALLVGSDVVYLAARGVRAATMTPYDVAAIRLRDGLGLAGTLPADAERYIVALRSAAGARAAALTPAAMTTAAELVSLVEGLVGAPWSVAEAEARGAGALVGAYPGERAEG